MTTLGISVVVVLFALVVVWLVSLAWCGVSTIRVWGLWAMAFFRRRRDQREVSELEKIQREVSGQ